MAVTDEVMHIEDTNRPADAQSESNVSKEVDNPDDNVLLAQSHRPVLKRTFNFSGLLASASASRIPRFHMQAVSARACCMEGYKRRSLVLSWLAVCSGLSFLVLLRKHPRFHLLEYLSRERRGQYHFTYIVAPEKHRRLAAYCVGVLSIVGWWVITCSGISNNVQSIIGMVIFINPGFQHQLWHSYLLYVAIILLTLIPIFTIPQRHLGKWTQFCLALSITAFIAVTATMLSMCDEYNDASLFLKFHGTSGWPRGVAWVMGVGNAMYAFASLDAVIHVAEEMHSPSKEIPRAMNLTIIIGLFTAVPFTIAMIFVVKDLDAVRNSALPSLELFHQATGRKDTAIALQSILTIVFYTCMPSQWITCGRLTWAFSRDKGVPWSEYWNHVHPTRGFPVRTTCLSVVFCIIYGLLYMASTPAFNSIITTAVLAVNISYCIPQGITLVYGREKRLPFRHFNLGRLGYFCNAWAPLWIATIGIFICFPNHIPVVAASMNYVCVVLGFVAALLVSLWFTTRGQFDGPNIDWEALNKSNKM